MNRDLSFGKLAPGGLSGFRHLRQALLILVIAAWVGFSSVGSAQNSYSGMLVPGFVPVTNHSQALSSIHALPDGSALCMAFQLSTNYEIHNQWLTRIQENGSPEPVWRSLAFYNVQYARLKSLIRQPDGKLLVAGGFDQFKLLLRLNRDGTIDPTFSPEWDEHDVRSIYSVGVRSDGKIAVAVSRLYSADTILLLNQDGSIDSFCTILRLPR